MSTFTEHAWAETRERRDAVPELPSNLEIAENAPCQERFRFYMVQDALYLQQYSRALSIAAAKAPDRKTM